MMVGGMGPNSCIFVRFKRGSRGTSRGHRASPKSAFSTGLHHFMGRAHTGKKVPILFGTVIHHGFQGGGGTMTRSSIHGSLSGKDTSRSKRILVSARKGCLRSPHGITGRLSIPFISVGGVARSLIRRVKPRTSGGLFV